MKMFMIHLWREIESSFWFIPISIVIGAVFLAFALIHVDATTELNFLQQWPLLFGAGAAGSRGLLATIATSMITVAGVIFSITLVALALTTSQYTSRVLRNFMRDRFNQAVLGVFVGIFAYCLVVLRTIRAGDEAAFIPTLSVLMGLILSFVGVIVLIFYIHHIAMAIQVSNIIAAVAHETLLVVDKLYPHELRKHADEEAEMKIASSFGGEIWSTINGGKTGYIEQIDHEALWAVARKYEVLLRFERSIGEFIVEDTPLLSVAGHFLVTKEILAELNAAYSVNCQRTLHQDAAYGIRQLVDIALKALSPGINDSTTAIMCVDYLGAIFVRLSRREIILWQLPKQRQPWVIARGPNFELLLNEAFDQIRQNARNNIAVLTRLLQTIEMIANQTENGRRRLSLWRHGKMIAAVAEQGIYLPEEDIELQASLFRLSNLIANHKRY